MKIKIAPSILAADFSCLGKEIKRVEEAGCDMLHIDVMDGHFVPNITMGPVVIKAIRKLTKLPIESHLMIQEPQKLVDAFVSAGSDMVTLHIETISGSRFSVLASRLRSQGIKVGVSLNPNTPLKKIGSVLKYVDFVLVMSVNPGFSGQAFMPEVIPKIKKLRCVFNGDIAVDGGVNDKVSGTLIEAGANILVSASYIFGAEDVKEAVERIRHGK